VGVSDYTIIQEKNKFYALEMSTHSLLKPQHWRTGIRLFGIEERLTTVCVCVCVYKPSPGAGAGCKYAEVVPAPVGTPRISVALEGPFWGLSPGLTLLTSSPFEIEAFTCSLVA
jgi:hypothetical protein